MGRPAPAGRNRPRPGPRSAAAAARRAVRRSGRHHPPGARARVSLARGQTPEGDGLRHARRARRVAARFSGGAARSRAADVSGHAGRVSRQPAARGPQVHGRCLTLFQFYASHASEVWWLLGQHVSLVVVSSAIALGLGLPLGILAARHPAWRRPVLGVANVFQTIPSLAVFGLLIPLFGIGAWTAITALVVYALLPIVRNTYAGIAGVDPPVAQAGRGMGMTDGELLRLGELPPPAGVIVAGVRIATVVSVGIATIAAADGPSGPR